MKPYLTSLSCFSPIMAPTSHIAYLTLALGFLIFSMCLLHLSYLLNDSVEPVKKRTRSLASLDVKVDAYRILKLFPLLQKL